MPAPEFLCDLTSLRWVTGSLHVGLDDTQEVALEGEQAGRESQENEILPSSG
jgi:hypothetical protein